MVVLQFYCNALAGLLPFTELVLSKLESFTDFFDLPKAAIKKYIEIESIYHIDLFIFYLFPLYINLFPLYFNFKYIEKNC